MLLWLSRDRSLSQNSTSHESTPQTSAEPEVFRFDDLSTSVQQIPSQSSTNCHYERLFQNDPGR